MIRQLLVASTIGLGVLGPCGVSLRADAPADAGSDDRPPTALEQALIGHACNKPKPADTTEFEAQMRCSSAELRLLRGDFGYDLGRVPASDRKEIDAACSGIRRPEQRDVYLDCLSARLVALHTRMVRESPAVPADSAVAVPPAAEAVLPGPAAPDHRRFSWLLMLLMGAAAAVVAAVGARLVGRRPRIVRHACRTCGAEAPGVGDLCADCRRRAAEAFRQESAARAAREYARQSEERREREEKDEEGKERKQEPEHPQTSRGDDLHHQADESRVQAPPAILPQPVEEVFDPYAVLGVSPGTSPDGVRAAYEEARRKYDENAVAHLGDEVRQHFKAKAAAVERASDVLGLLR